SILRQQREKFEQSQQRLIESVTKTLRLPSTSVTSNDNSASVDTIAAAISDFHFETSAGHTFGTWLKRWKDTFQSEFPGKDYKRKSQLLDRKFGTVEYKRFTNVIFPEQSKGLDFDQTVKQLRDDVGEQSSSFDVRYNCPMLKKRESDDYIIFTDFVNRECEKVSAAYRAPPPSTTVGIKLQFQFATETILTHVLMLSPSCSVSIEW
ncbi:hypothetical protein PHET_11508, partial [Paragonimus heterotremus]